MKLLIGRARTGKTDQIMQEIKQRMGAGESGMFLIVPEQYSHHAERQLCTVCGDALSLHAEVLSFTRLCSHVFSETGDTSLQTLDSTGQVLAMYKAIESVALKLKVYNLKKMHIELLEKLLEAVNEFKTLNITALTLNNASKKISGLLSDKLHDLSLIFDAYDATLHVHGGDAADRLTLLADKIAESSFGETGHIYFDGFNDFTVQELCVIEELMRKGVNITVSITCDMENVGEIFKLPHRTISQLERIADNYGVKVTQQVQKSSSNSKYMNSSAQHRSLTFLEQYLFDDDPPKYESECDNIRLYTAPNRYVECEYAAYEIWNMVKNGYRWRDIGVMVRNWEEYASVCENVFDKYGIPYFASGKVDILSKPPLALIDAALEIAISNWEYTSIFRYLKTGLTDISVDECATLENYVLKWQIRGTMWNREWIMPPNGYGRERDDDAEQLFRLNKLRLKVINPLNKLRESIKGESITEAKLKELYYFLEEINLQKRLNDKANDFISRGELRLADEYLQLWDIIISAMEQMYTILGDDNINAPEFHKVLAIALSQNNVGTIPISLDRTMLGGMAMNRRRSLKAIIILGATDDNLPTLGKPSGALSDNERTLLHDIIKDIPAGLEERLCREMNMLYSTLTLPSNELILTYATSEGQRPSYIVKRLCQMFSIDVTELEEEQYMTVAETPYNELMLSRADLSKESDTPLNNRQLSEEVATLLYGTKFALSATSVDRYYSCPYKHFLQNGLKLEPRTFAEFDAMTAGNFMHYVLDGVFNEIKENIGFDNADEESYVTLAKKYITEYEKDILLNFEGKNQRFEYLFRRHRTDVEFVVRDMANEIRHSDFVPLDFELNMSQLSATERGLIDRVDGYDRDGKMYIRVIDYKTRKSAYKFEMSDILYGRDMQMLIYLFALTKHGQEKYGKIIEPAGVLYVPARDVILSTPRNATDSDVEKARIKEMRRSGLVLNDINVLDAMESGESKNYLPVTTKKDGTLSGDSLISRNQMKLLSKHVDSMMENAKNNIKSGNNECKPYYISDSDNACIYCEYKSVCKFDETTGDKYQFVAKRSSEEVWELLGDNVEGGNSNDRK